MQQIEIAVAQHDALARAPPLCHAVSQLEATQDFVFVHNSYKQWPYPVIPRVLRG
jgi:hypothetical protein